jgi:hypothetical protein
MVEAIDHDDLRVGLVVRRTPNHLSRNISVQAANVMYLPDATA